MCMWNRKLESKELLLKKARDTEIVATCLMSLEIDSLARLEGRVQLCHSTKSA